MHNLINFIILHNTCYFTIKKKEISKIVKKGDCLKKGLKNEDGVYLEHY